MKSRLLSLALLAVVGACGPAERPGPDGDDAGTPATDGGSGGGTPDAGGGGDTSCTATGGTGSQEGDVCNDAIKITLKCDGPLEITGTTVGASDAVNQAEGSTCRQSGESPDRIYQLTVPAGRTVKATVKSGDDTFDPAIILLAAADCGVALTQCLAGDDSGSATTENSVTYTAGETDTDVFVVIDNWTQETGPFELRISFPQPLSGDTCADAEPLTLGTTYSDQTLDGANDDYPQGTNCRSGKADRAYSVSVPPGKVLRVNVTPGAGLDPVVNLVAGGAAACAGELTCVAGRDNGSSGQAETVTWQNDTSGDVDIIVLVEAYSTSNTGSFSVVARLEDPPGPSLGGDTCDTAYGVNAPETLTGESLNTASPDLDADETCVWALSGPDRMYSVLVPDGQTLSVTLTPTTQEDLSLYMVAGAAACSAGTLECLTGDDSGYDGEAEMSSWANSTGAPVTVIVVVDASSSVGDEATFNLAMTLAATAP